MKLCVLFSEDDTCMANQVLSEQLPFALGIGARYIYQLVIRHGTLSADCRQYVVS